MSYRTILSSKFARERAKAFEDAERVAAMSEGEVEAFWAAANRSGADECWLWGMSRNVHGYGQKSVRGKVIRAHRIALILERGPAPHAKYCALHSCGNRACCNPRHLRWGEHSDNMLDRTKDGKHPTMKLTPEQVMAIRADVRSSHEVAKKYPVSARTVREIRQGKKWAWL